MYILKHCSSGVIKLSQVNTIYFSINHCHSKYIKNYTFDEERALGNKISIYFLADEMHLSFMSLQIAIN